MAAVGFAAAMAALCVAILFQLTSCASHGQSKRYPNKLDKSRIPSKLLVMSDRNMTGLRFYPTLTDQLEDGLNVSYASQRNVFPLPGCPCVPRLDQCDFECCYCDLGCPLPRSPTDGEGWLEKFYGDECLGIRERKEILKEKKGLLSLEERRQISSKASDYLCQRADYPLNARMAFYQFFCLEFDNSLSSFHYDVRPRGPNLIRLSDHASQRFWPSSQTFYENRCNNDSSVAELIADQVSKWADQVAQSVEPHHRRRRPDEPSLLEIRANQLFLFQPPPPPHRSPSKGQPCLGNGMDGDDILKARISTTSARPHQNKMDAHQLLEDVIAGLWRRKMMSSWAPLDFMTNKTVESCQHFRSLVASATRPWISRLLEMAQGNKSNPFGSIPIKVLEAKTLNTTQKRFEVGSQKETFPEYCLRVIEGLEIVAYYDQLSLIQLTYQVETGDGPIGNFRSLDVRIKPVFVHQATKSRLSRFWTEFYNHHCPDQFCWRDLLEDFYGLKGNTFSILLAFISAPSFLLLLFPQISYDVI